MWLNIQTSPVEQPIHQQESDWLQGSGSPYTMSHTTISVPLHLFTLVIFLLPHLVSMHNSSLLLSSHLLPYPDVCFTSPSLWAPVPLFSPRRHHSFPPSLPPTGWAVKQERAHGRPLTTRKAALELCGRANDCRLCYKTVEPNMVHHHHATNGSSGPEAIHTPWCNRSSTYFCIQQSRLQRETHTVLISVWMCLSSGFFVELDTHTPQKTISASVCCCSSHLQLYNSSYRLHNIEHLLSVFQ